MGARILCTHPRANIPDLVHLATIIVHSTAQIWWTQEALVPGRSTTAARFCVSLSLSDHWLTVRDWGRHRSRTTLVGVPDPDVALRRRAPPRRVPARVVRVAGILVALLALSLCGLALATNGGSVKLAIDHADYHYLWSRFWLPLSGCRDSVSFGGGACESSVRGTALLDSIGWYFAGELGKYLPGGIWPVFGRGQLAYRRGGISQIDGIRYDPHLPTRRWSRPRR